ncbi:MAG: rod shape-determining protein MreC [Bacteroidetes bacterium]|nr:rod shape-determining protein MreC [Bacteroidota bacterium]
MLKIFSNFWNKFKEYIVLVILILVSLFTLSNNNNSAVKNVRIIAFSSFAFFSNIISDITSSTLIKNKNKKLRKLNAELMLQVNLLRKYGIENQELKSLLSLKDTASYPLISASVVSKSLNTASNTFTLNSGKTDGVKPGMPVINDLGLIGIVYTVSDNYSIIKTLRNVELRITVKDERSRVNAILKWDGDDLILTNIPKTSDIKIGDRIVSSDISTIVPLPIPIGYIISINNKSTDIFNRVKIKSFADLTSVENVFIIKMIKSFQVNKMELNFFKKRNSAN